MSEAVGVGGVVSSFGFGVKAMPVRSHAFTLVELLIAIAILAILMGIAVPAYNEMTLGSKLDTALADPAAVQRLFGAESTNPTERGFGLKFKTFADGLNNSGGAVANRTEALRNAISRNSKEMDKVVERASRAEARYLAQYNAMDAAVGKLNGLNAFVTQQISLWNKNTG